MTMLPAATDFTGATITEGQFKTAITDQRAFLYEKLGSDGSVAIQAFATGTLMLFQQTAAPTGWTKQTTHNDKTLRVVSGTASSGGSSAFSTVFGKTVTDGTTLTGAQSGVPAHTHAENGVNAGGAKTAAYIATSQSLANATIVATSTLSDYTNSTRLLTDSNTAASAASAHTHPMDIRVQYVDLIIAAKD